MGKRGRESQRKCDERAGGREVERAYGEDVEDLKRLERTIGSSKTHGSSISRDERESNGFGEANDGDLVRGGSLVGDSFVAGDRSDLEDQSGNEWLDFELERKERREGRTL